MVDAKPVITSYLVSQSGANWLIEITTDIPAYLYILSQQVQPHKHIRRKVERGVPLDCGFTWQWIDPVCTVQTVFGPTTYHAFLITAGVPPWGLHFFFSDNCAFDLATWTSPIFYTGDWVGPSAPQPFIGTESTGQPGFLVGPGRPLMWWANNDWYAVIPHTTQIAVCKRNGGTWDRLDVAGEPSPAPDTFGSVATYLSLDGTTIHIAYHINRPSPTVRPIYWTTFDTLTDTWGTFELVVQVTNNPYTTGNVLIVEIPSGWPAIFYSNPTSNTGRVYYTERATGSWSTPELVTSQTFRPWAATCLALDPLTYDVHVITNSTANQRRHRKRSLSGVWSADSEIPGVDYSGDFASLTHDGTTLAHGRLNPIDSISIVSGDPPSAEENDLVPPIVYAQTLLSSLAYPGTLWFFADPAGGFANYWYRHDPGGLSGPITYTAQGINRSSATLNGTHYAGVLLSGGTPFTTYACAFALETP